ncbi:MAG: zinc ribbon domain-containing protein [Vicinamibacterales bacterium]
MPLFDYTCRGCAHTFEHLTRAGSEPVCPQCGGADVEKQFSMSSSVGAPVPTAAQKEATRIERAGWVPVGKPFRNRR